MKVIQSAAIGVCLITSIAVQAQEKSNDTATKVTPPVIEKNKDSISKSESKKEEYKSKEWRQGIEGYTDTTKGSGDKLKSRMRKKAQKQGAVPPPPAPALPPAPPAKPK